MNYATEIDRAIDGEDMVCAMTLAQQWVAEEPEQDAAWSQLAHIYVVDEDFGRASKAIREALSIVPDCLPYLFEYGYIEYRLANYALAANAFALCVEQSDVMRDGFYLDAARIAQARCLVLDGRANLAGSVIAKAAPDSATWLDGRFSREDVMKSIIGASPHQIGDIL